MAEIGRELGSVAGNEFWDVGAGGAEALSSPLLLIKALLGNREAGSEFMKNYGQRRGGLPQFETPLLEQALAPVGRKMGEIAQKYPEEAQLGRDLLSDPSIQTLLTALGPAEYLIPGRAAASALTRGPLERHQITPGSPKAQIGAIDITTGIDDAPRRNPAEYQPVTGAKGQEKFNRTLAEARASMKDKDRAQVDPNLPEDFKGQIFLTPDEMAGFSLDEQGYFGHLFGGGKKGTMPSALTRARAEGGHSLDAFDAGLVDAYKRFGAEERNRFPWNPDFASPDVMKGLGELQPDFVGLDIGGAIPKREHSFILGPRPQDELRRNTLTPKGKPIKRPASVDLALDPRNLDYLKEMVRKGVEVGGDEWYWLGGLADAFAEQLGPEMGLKRFGDTMDIDAIFSAGSDPWTEMKRASVIRNMMAQGQDVANIGADAFPAGYGHPYTTTAHRPGLNRWLEQGIVGDPMDPNKTPRYAEALKGNYNVYVPDRHASRLLFENTPLAGKSNLTSGELAFIEPAMLELAGELGMPGSAMQAAKWVGGADITGVRPTALGPVKQGKNQMYNNALARYAISEGISEQEALRRFIDWDMILK